MTEKAIHVIKRNGHKELIHLEKIHVMTSEACEDLSGVSASQVEMNSDIQFYDGIKTSDIQQILVRSAADLIDLRNNDFLPQWFADTSAIIKGRKGFLEIKYLFKLNVI